MYPSLSRTRPIFLPGGRSTSRRVCCLHRSLILDLRRLEAGEYASYRYNGTVPLTRTFFDDCREAGLLEGPDGSSARFPVCGGCAAAQLLRAYAGELAESFCEALHGYTLVGEYLSELDCHITRLCSGGACAWNCVMLEQHIADWRVVEQGGGQSDRVLCGGGASCARDVLGATSRAGLCASARIACRQLRPVRDARERIGIAAMRANRKSG